MKYQIMKKLLVKISASLCIALAATSCLNDVLEVESQSFDASVVFSNYTLAEYNVFAIADLCGATNGYRGRLDLWYGFNTDVEHYSSGSNGNAAWNTNANLQLAEYNTDPGNGNMNTGDNGYIQFFNAIERANVCIVNLRKYANLNDPDMAYLLGESLTWRAFLYSELIKMWGEAPLRTEPVTEATMYLPKVDRDELYLQILADLDEAIPMLYEPFASPQTQSAFRVNKALACGLYARVALAAAGWAWRPDDGQVGTSNMGSLRLSVNPELSKAVLYPKALAYLEDALKMGNSLETSYEQLWRKFNNSEHLTSKEVLWVRPFSNGRGRWNYTHAGSHSVSEYINGGTRGGSTGPAPTLWWKYEKEDVRRDLTCVPWYYNGDASADHVGFQVRGRVNYWFWGKYRYEWMFANPYSGGNDDGIKPIIMRYSDIYLMAAEIAAYEGDLAKAKQYLLPVRQRAYAGNEAKASAYVNALTIGSAAGSDNAAVADHKSQGTIMKAIIDERALEFAGEMLRKQDLIRWGLLKIAMDESAADIKALAEMTGDYAAYNAYAEDKSSSSTGHSYKEYRIYWRENRNGYPQTGYNPVEIFGLEADEIGKVPADYSAAEPNGWVLHNFIASEGFYSSTNDEWRYESGYYRNEFNDPYPRSVWPHFAQPIMLSQGALVNDYGY